MEVDSSKDMLEQAAKTGLYQDFRLVMLGPELLPAEADILLSEIQHRTPLAVENTFPHLSSFCPFSFPQCTLGAFYFSRLAKQLLNIPP